MPPATRKQGDSGQAVNLFPGLPDDVGARILCLIPFSHQSRLKPTCKSWQSFFSSSIPIRAHLSCTDHLLCIFPQDPSISAPYLFDHRNLAWMQLPCMPCNAHVYGLSNFSSVSLGADVFVIGGSLFDTRSFPMDRPLPTSAGYKYCFLTSSWSPITPMISPRGSFACAAIPSLRQIFVAGGGSRHAFFGAAGSRMCSAERYDAALDRWVPVEGLPQCRAGCFGFSAGEREFWVMGGYGNLRTISRVFPVDEYYKDAVVMDVKKTREWESSDWREVGDMWKEGERLRLGKLVTVDNREDSFPSNTPALFMLDNSDIFRYDMNLNMWSKETSVPRKPLSNAAFGFVALDGELHVMCMFKGDAGEPQRSRPLKRTGLLLLQIYNPRTKTWRSLSSRSPLPSSLDFRTAVMCTIRL